MANAWADLGIAFVALGLWALLFGLACYGIQRRIVRRYQKGKPSTGLRADRSTDQDLLRLGRIIGPYLLGAAWLLALVLVAAGRPLAGPVTYCIFAAFILGPLTSAGWGFEFALRRSGTTNEELQAWLQYGKRS